MYMHPKTDKKRLFHQKMSKIENFRSNVKIKKWCKHAKWIRPEVIRPRVAPYEGHFQKNGRDKSKFCRIFV